MPLPEAVLITGAQGLLGRAVVRRLSPDCQVYAVVRKMPQQPEPGVRYIALDLSVPWAPEALPSRLDAVVHLAQSPHFRNFPAQAWDVFQVNVSATALLLDHARRVGARHFVYASSGGVYGAGEAPFREHAPFAPAAQLGHYLATKVAGEVLCGAYASLMHVKVLRFFFIYGAGQNRSMLLPRLFDNILAGRPITVQGDQGLQLNPIHVSDASLAVARALTLPASVTFNVAGAEVLSLRALAECIGAQVGRPPLIESQVGEPRHAVGDIVAMRESLCMPVVPLVTGLTELAA